MSICLFSRYRSQFKNNFHQTSQTGRHRSTEELTKFWNSSASGYGYRTLLKNSSTLRDLHKNFITDVSLDKDVLNKFGTYPDLWIRSPDPYTQHIRTSLITVQLTFIAFGINQILFDRTTFDLDPNFGKPSICNQFLVLLITPCRLVPSSWKAGSDQHITLSVCVFSNSYSLINPQPSPVCDIFNLSS